jgi:hypothetical protein
MITLLVAEASAALRTLDEKRYHLRSGNQPEWEEFANRIPHGRRLDVRFTTERTLAESTLFVWQDDVKLDWALELNGQKLGKLFPMEAPLVYALPVPGGLLRSGENTLSVLPPKENDDIVVGEFKFDPRPLKEAVNQATLEIQVLDSDSRKGLPCRITLTDRRGSLMPVYASTNQPVAARPGVVYTADGKARIGVLPGDYILYATRGFEYGLDRKRVSIKAAQSKRVQMKIRREVPTPGLVSCDTHVHTFTFSRHGDATTEERVITLAGEGIELPIATDHDILTDFSGPARKMSVRDYFTPVIGDEVTTKVGHFNIFPINTASRVPDAHIEQWPKLMQEMRATPGVKVVILNHPRNIHNGFQPFAKTNFNSVSGEGLQVLDFGFDAMELMNSSALQSDLMLVYRDWFALLNAGHRVTAVGSSDCHDVSRYIVGQGRTYLMCSDANPAGIDVDDAGRSFLKGRALVSMGLLTQMTVNDHFGVGDLATGISGAIRVGITVLGPSWVKADRVELFANGVKVRDQRLTSLAGNRAEKVHLAWTMPRPTHDVYLVAMATGPGVAAPYWAISRPYQSSSPVWRPRVVGSTNPIWVDADGDGRFTSARAYAQGLIQRHGADPAKLLPSLASYDEAVAAQAAALCHSAGLDLRSPEFKRSLAVAPQTVQRGFAAFSETVLPIEP